MDHVYCTGSLVFKVISTFLFGVKLVYYVANHIKQVLIECVFSGCLW
mgnify:CR=1 FL=1